MCDDGMKSQSLTIMKNVLEGGGGGRVSMQTHSCGLHARVV